MKITLRKAKPYPAHCQERWLTLDWKKAAPFVVNPRAILTHRVKSVRSHFDDLTCESHSHYSVDFWCGNGSSGSPLLVEIPPEDRLLCARCEEVAVKAGEKSAEELAGRHVHIGELRAKRLCCLNEEN